MNDDEFINAGNNRCSSLNIVLKNEGILGGPHCAIFDYDFNGSILHIKIEQCLKYIGKFADVDEQSMGFLHRN